MAAAYQTDEPHSRRIVVTPDSCLFGACASAVRLVDYDARARAPVLPKSQIFGPGACPLFGLWRSLAQCSREVSASACQCGLAMGPGPLMCRREPTDPRPRLP